MLISAAKTVKLYDLDAGKSIRTINNSTDNTHVYSMAVIDENVLCTGDDEGYFRLWDYRSNNSPPAMELKETSQHISDFDVDSEQRNVLASCGDGSISCFNIRAKKLVPPQSELDESEYTCLRFLESKQKVVVGSENGKVLIFNVGEYGYRSDVFPVCSSGSVDRIEVLSDSVIAAGTSDGRTRILNILPNKQLSVLFNHDDQVESISVQQSTTQVASIAGNTVKVASFVEVESSSSEESDAGKKGKHSDSDSDQEYKPKKKKKSSADPSGRSAFFSDLF